VTSRRASLWFPVTLSVPVTICWPVSPGVGPCITRHLTAPWGVIRLPGCIEPLGCALVRPRSWEMLCMHEAGEEGR
jgi:hypothetical protein